jgi:molecular chaperone GrpE
MNAPNNTVAAINWQGLYDVLAKRSEQLETDMRALSEKIQRTIDENVLLTRKDLLLQVLAIGDDISRLDKAAESGTPPRALHDGITLIQRKFAAFIERSNVKTVPADPGTRFDPRIHEADNIMPSTQFSSETIIQASQPGYLLDNVLLRPARVCVSSGAPQK